MTFRFDNGELVQYEHPLFGKGKGVIVGYSPTDQQWVVYAKRMLKRDDYPFMCFFCESKDLISTPF